MNGYVYVVIANTKGLIPVILIGLIFLVITIDLFNSFS